MVEMLGGRPVDARVDTSRWNLFASGALGLAALTIGCGPVIGAPEGDTDDPSDPTESTNPSDPSGPDPTQGECVEESDCSYGYSCINNFCQYDCYCGCGASPPPSSQLRCSEGPGYECYGDYDCAEDELCEYGSCQPDPDPDPIDCSAIPLRATSIELVFGSESDSPVRSLQFADVSPAPGVDLLVGRDVTIERVTDGANGEIVVDSPGEIFEFAAGDADGDGVVDIVTAQGDGSLRFWRGSDGELLDVGVVQIVGIARAVFIADRDADGVRDVYAHVDRDVFVLPTIEGVPLGEPVRLLEDRVDDVAPFDAKGDGEIELLFAEGGSLWVYRELQSPAPEVLYESSNLFSPIVVGDFSGDAEPDAAAFTDQNEQITLVGEIATTPGLAELSTPQTASAAGDIDGDGRADLVILEPEVGSVLVRFGADAGAPGEPRPPFRCDTRYAIEAVGSRIAVGDIDGDGRAELAVADGWRVILVRF